MMQHPPGVRHVPQMESTWRTNPAERAVSRVLFPEVWGAASDTTAS